MGYGFVAHSRRIDMANISDAHGRYLFNFTNTKLVKDPQAKQAFINTLHNLTSQYSSDGNYRQYYTNFDIESLDLDAYNHATVEVNFNGCGRWWYLSNLEWYCNAPELRDHLLTCDGLIMTVSYHDMESEIYAGEVQVVVRDDEVQIVSSYISSFECTPERAVGFGFYDNIEYFLENNL